MISRYDPFTLSLLGSLLSFSLTVKVYISYGAPVFSTSYKFRFKFGWIIVFLPSPNLLISHSINWGAVHNWQHFQNSTHSTHYVRDICPDDHL